MKKLTLIALVGLLSLGFVAGLVAQTVTVGSKQFTEQLILGKISVLALQANGFTVVDQTNLGSTFQNRTALLEGQIDTYWEYNGTASSNFADSLGLVANDAGEIVDPVTGESAPVSDADQLTAFVAARDAAHNDLIWLPRTAFNDSFELITTADFAAANNLESISDLAAAVNSGAIDPIFCAGTEFLTRQKDGIPEIERVYGFVFNRDKLVDVGTNLGIGPDLLTQGKCDVIGTTFTTDGRIPALGLKVLADDQAVFPKFNPSPIFRGAVLRANPSIASIISPLPALLTQAVQTCLNARVDILGEDPEDVAQLFLNTGTCPAL